MESPLKKQISKNILFSVLDVLSSSIVLFVLYKYIIDTIGIEKLGIWSLILAATSISRISEFGLSGSVVKFVAKYIALGKKDDASKVIETTLITLSLFFGLMLSLAYWPIAWGIKYIVPPEGLHLAQQLVPYALISLWLTIITTVVQSGLDGCQRIDLRRMVMICGNILYLITALMLISKYGLLGLAYSQIIQQIALLISSLVILWKILPEVSVIPKKWTFTIFREILKYGLNFQAISILAMFIDPLTKILLGKFGALDSVGYYEMASKVVQKFRSLLINANQVMVPVYATLQEYDAGDIKNVYKINVRMIMYLSIPGYLFIIALSPAISSLWIGHYEPFFLFCIVLLSFAWLVNTINAPAYFAFMGIGRLRWNLVGHVVMASLCLILGISLGMLYGEHGVITGRFLSSGIGGWIVIHSFHKENRLPLNAFCSREDLLLFLYCTLSAVVSIVVYVRINSVTFSSLWCVSTFTVILLWTIWRHPAGMKVASWALDRHMARQT
jgi:O-antigen/teichoic acid export membrane protein